MVRFLIILSLSPLILQSQARPVVGSCAVATGLVSNFAAAPHPLFGRPYIFGRSVLKLVPKNTEAVLKQDHSITRRGASSNVDAFDLVWRVIGDLFDS